MSKGFSHVPQFTGYMQRILNYIQQQEAPKKILDIPAGNGLLAQKLREKGHHVTCADINQAQAHYVYADMTEPLPFADNEFDLVICMEGIEHILNPAQLVEELCRVCKPQGQIIISLPNIQNLYSRLQFLCTGTFYQFPPILPTEALKTQKLDRGHISSLSYIQLRYLFKCFDADLVDMDGDKHKRRILSPLLLFFTVIGRFWLKRVVKGNLSSTNEAIPTGKASLFRPPLLFSRSLILMFEKS